MPAENVSATVRSELERERQTLVGQLEELGYGDTGRLAYDSNFADTSQVTAERGETAVLASRLRESLDDVEMALRKIEDGNFGTCEKCASSMSQARLEAMPTGRLCMDCASGTR